MKTAYVVGVQSIISDRPYKSDQSYDFYLIDDSTKCVVGMFDSIEELQVFADLHDYAVKELSKAEPFRFHQYEAVDIRRDPQACSI